MAETGTTAVLAVLPEAEPLLELAAELDARAVRPGVPAHAALLYPWLAADRVDEPALRRLRTALPEGRIEVELTAVEHEGGFVGVPVPGLSAAATAVRAAFPEEVPYGGRFGTDPPVHVTVALGAAPEAAAGIARRAAARLPVTARIATLHVVALGPTGWRSLAELPLTRRSAQSPAARPSPRAQETSQ